MTELYGKLAARFDRHHKDPRGLEYLTGEQVVSRLNEVLGPSGWSFAVKEHGYEAEADELWALGHLEATVDGVPLVREQFGSQKHNRRRSDGQILDCGFDLKGAATDALKKCATLIGVGLYLAEKDGGIPQEDVGGVRQKTAPERQPASPPAKPQPPVPIREREVEDLLVCVECKHPIVAQTGEFINATQADIIRDRFGALVCREHRAGRVGV